MSKPSILCVGIAVQDYVFGLPQMPVTPEKHRAQSLEIVGGGIAANAAVAIARLGGRVQLVTRLGDDLTGAAIIADLESEGVDCALARRFAGCRSSQSAVLVDAAGERLVVNYADPNIPDDPSWLPANLSSGVRGVLGDTRWESGALRLFAAAREAGGFAVLDGDRAVQNPALIAAASHVIFAAQALREMTGRDDLAAGLGDIVAMTSAWIAVTDGVRGTLVHAPGGAREIPAFPVKAVDTLAAGDVFHGAFALALAEGMDEGQAVRFSAAVAALKCTRFGGRAGTPTRAETDEFLQGQF